jgi:hypothetical protein
MAAGYVMYIHTRRSFVFSLYMARHSCSGGPLRISQNPPQTVTIAVAHQGSLPHADTRSQQQQQPQQQQRTTSTTSTTATAAAPTPSQQQQQQRRLSSSGSGSSSSVRVGPPRKLFLVPAVVPPTLAVLDYNGNLGAVDLISGQCR